MNSRPYDGRPPCNDCGLCSGYGCSINAKGSPAVTLLRKALLTGRCQLRPETRAVRLLSQAGAISGVEVIGPDGSRQTLRADRYVLAASPIEDARLLLLSDPGGPGLGNSSGMVGRNLMFHFQTQAIGIFNERFHGHRGRSVTHGIADFRGVPGDPQHPLGGIIEIGTSSEALGESINYVTFPGIGTKLKNWVRQSPFRDRLMALEMQAEDAPQLTNRVDLDPKVRDLDGLPVARVTYSNHAFELGARAFYSPKMLDILVKAGAKYAFIAPSDDPPQSRHVMGTLRCGNDSKTSVCDPTGRFHDYPNLYAADGSLFPTSAGYNPILTIVTVASRVAGEMISPGSPEKALPPA